MTPQTLKMLIMFFLAAALLNLTNYATYMFYDPPDHTALKLDIKVHAPRTRRFLARSRVTRAINWSMSMLCTKIKSKVPTKESTSETSPTIDFLADYKEQTTETNSLYYYNGIRMGPVLCPLEPPGLGPVKPDDRINLDAIENLYSILRPGGFYEESSCTPLQTVAIIVPCREYTHQVTEFLYSLLPILIKQQLEYQVYLVEQVNKTQPLNRGKLMNVGFTEAQRMKKNGGWRCIVFHHHHLVPADSRNLYRCSDQPRQLALSLDSNQYVQSAAHQTIHVDLETAFMPSYEIPFGGVIAIKPQQFMKINGFSNLYIGNEAVYDDFYARLIDSKFSITKSNSTIADYTLLSPTNNDDTPMKNQSQPISTSSPLNLLDGLSTLTYTLCNLDLKSLYTSIEVDLDRESQTSASVLGERLWDKLLNQATSSQTEQTKNRNDTLKNILLSKE